MHSQSPMKPTLSGQVTISVHHRLKNKRSSVRGLIHEAVPRFLGSPDLPIVLNSHETGKTYSNSIYEFDHLGNETG